MNNICANCHYSFAAGGFCKCKLNISTENRAMKSFMRKQQIIGYRMCLMEHRPNDEVLSDEQISELIENQNALLRTEITKIFD